MDKKRIELYDILYNYLLVLRKPFADFLLKHMVSVYGDKWWELCVLPNLRDQFKMNLDDLDMYDLLNTLLSDWGSLYNSIKGNNEFSFVYDENFRLIYEMLILRNMVSHANENDILINDIYRQITVLRNFAVFIEAREYMIFNLNIDLEKFKKDRDFYDEIRKERLLETIHSEVLFNAMICKELPADVKASVLRSMITTQNMKTAAEIYEYYANALQSTNGHWVYKNLKERNLTTFEDIRDKVNELMREN